MKRESINPMKWGLNLSIDQGEVLEGGTRHLRCSGQVSLKDDPDAEMGFSVVAPGDLRSQMECTFNNIDDVLQEAKMDRSNIVSIRFFTTDMDGFLKNYDVYTTWIAEAGTKPPQSLIGVARLVLEELLVEIEIEAVS